ncbi:DUF1206 domain-containing protein [Sphingomonas mucosissima]|uniref:DUF1206 domain-containing protein n=1 Tax=Sphingomonas mucosissima TaxID=370959 RepID=A0A245ZGY4_9SPHN|nr:DUF1206 domain-containing protein [Sphingomonas mucosissima]OWK29012.1 hypothetical protein SPMU_25380 [Sphingomonas mucosissima]
MNASARLTTLTRLGFATRGLLYIVIAFLILRTGRAEDPAGALRYLGESGGQLLLGVMAAGLIGYGIWRLSDAAFDIERHGSDRHGTLQRVGALASGVTHLFLAWQAIRLMQGAASSGDSTREGTQTALSLPGGSFLVMLGGVVLVGVGILQLAKAVKASFLDYLDPAIARQAWAQWSGRLGYGARGFVFMITGYFLLRAGFQEQGAEAGGMDKALAWLTNPWDIVIALGLLGFGIFGLIEARYRRLHDAPIDGMVRRATGRA